MAGVFVEGIDISHHNGKVDFQKVAEDGVNFVLMKATEGLTFKDSRFASNWAHAGSAKLKRGAYHFFRPGVSGKSQAANLIKTLKLVGFGKGDVVPTVDCEDYDGSGQKAYQTELQNFLDEVMSQFECRCLIYTYKGFWAKIGNPTSFGSFPLWVVDLSSVSKPRLPAGWTDYAIWQYTFSGDVDGISGDVDLDRFKGDLNDLDGLCL